MNLQSKPTIERHPGETFEYKPGVTLEVQPSCTCQGCHFAENFHMDRCGTRNREITGECSSDARTDHESIIFRNNELL